MVVKISRWEQNQSYVKFWNPHLSGLHPDFGSFFFFPKGKEKRMGARGHYIRFFHALSSFISLGSDTTRLPPCPNDVAKIATFVVLRKQICGKVAIVVLIHTTSK